MSTFVRSLWLKAVLLCILCAGMRQILPAQPVSTPSPANLPKYKLEGVVMNSTTGQPIPYSLVQILSITPRQSVLTDANGQFEFANLPAGRQLVQAHKPGFESRYRHRAPLVVELGADTPPVKVNLIPLAVITGRVVDERGQPLEGLIVRVVGWEDRQGQAGDHTDDEGNFRVPDLAPGKYFVVVQVGELEKKNFANPHEGYPPLVYYGGGTDRATASPLEVKVGEHIDLEFALKPVPTFKISGEIKGLASNFAFTVLDRSGDAVSFPTLVSDTDGSFTVEAVPAGSYTIKVSGHDGEGAILRAQTTVQVTGDVNGVRLIGQRGASIPVIVHHESPPELPSQGIQYKSEAVSEGKYYTRWLDQNEVPVSILLQPTSGDGDDASGPRRSTDGKALLLANVKPGAYSVTVQSTTGYVRSATCGTTDLLREDLVIPSNAGIPPIYVFVANDTGTLTIKGLLGGTGDRTAIIIVPDAVPRRPTVPLYIGGPETTVKLAPGHYKVLAFTWLNPDEYNNPDLINQYGSKASDVTILPNATATITANVIPAEEQ